MRSKVLFPAAIFLISFVLFAFRIQSSFNFDSDFGRDLVDIYSIAHGDLKLIGPKSSFGGLYTGPFYYYLFTPILMLFKYNPASILYFNAFLFSVGITIYWLILKKEYGTLKATSASISLMFLPIVLFSTRNPGNAYSYIPLLIVYISYALFQERKSMKELFLLGLMGSLLVTTHYSNIPITLLISVFIAILLRKKMPIIGYALGLFLPFAPLLLFEIKHQFVMIKNTFLNKSYQSFIESRNRISPHGFLGRVTFFNTEIAKLITLPPLFYFLPGIFSKNVKGDRKCIILFIFAMAAFITFSILFNFQYTLFYLTPLSIFIYLISIFLILKTRFWFLLFFIIGFQLITFPVHLYKNSVRPIARFEKAVDFILDHNILEKNKSFNIIQIRNNTNLTPHGYEYRYFFIKNGVYPLKETEYHKSTQLLIFSENSGVPLKSVNTWESKEFGTKYFGKYKQYEVAQITLFKISK